MSDVFQREAIAALATPPGTAGIAVIRISGAGAIEIADAVFHGNRPLAMAASHSAHFGEVVDQNGGIVDQAVATVFKSPQSYTGEDVVEISCHGGQVVSRTVLDRCLRSGARMAEPGEFTRRAFLNGKMDLSQAEAVADLIHAQSEDAHRASLEQLEGRLSKHIGVMRDGLIHAASLLELTLDFAEEDVELLDTKELHTELVNVRKQLADALNTYSSGKVIRHGVRVVIVGKPNAGKSSLLNALLNTRRAIVTEIPGTTRDYIEEPALIDGVLFRFVDTAGLRDTEDTVELLGIEYGKEVLQDADLACCLIDPTQQQAETASIAASRQEFQEAGIDPSTAMFVVNKVDLLDDDVKDNMESEAVLISALTGEGMDGLKKELVKRSHALKTGHKAGEILVTNVRHAECLGQSIGFVENALEALKQGMTEEILAHEIRSAIEALGEIIGEVVTDDILNSIFSRFCIGK